MKISRVSITASTKNAGEAEPRRLQVVLALRQQLAERGRAGRQAEAEEVERGQGGDRAVEDEGQEGQRRHHGIGQHVAPDDRRRCRRPARARRGHSRNCARAGIRRAPDRPATSSENSSMMISSHQKFGCDHAGKDDQEIEHRQAGPDLHEALKRDVDPTAVIALDRAGGDADDRAEDRQRQAEQHRDAKAIDQPCQHVAALIVGAEPIDTVGRRRRRRSQIVIDGVVGEGDQRPHDEAARLDALGDRGIAIIRRDWQIAAEIAFRCSR